MGNLGTSFAVIYLHRCSVFAHMKLKIRWSLQELAAIIPCPQRNKSRNSTSTQNQRKTVRNTHAPQPHSKSFGQTGVSERRRCESQVAVQMILITKAPNTEPARLRLSRINTRLLAQDLQLQPYEPVTTNSTLWLTSMLVFRGQIEQAWATPVLHWRWVLAAIVAAVAGCRHAGASMFENSFPTVNTPTYN